MTKNEYCRTHAPIASHTYYNSHVHGFDYGLDADYAYVSERVQPELFGPCVWVFHKLKVKTDSEGFPYIEIVERFYDGRKKRCRRYLEEYIRADSAWGYKYTLEEWQERLEV
jgi:hypothetical protein